MRFPLLAAVVVAVSSLAAHADTIITVNSSFGSPIQLTLTIPTGFTVAASTTNGFTVNNVAYVINGMPYIGSASFLNTSFGGSFSYGATTSENGLVIGSGNSASFPYSGLLPFTTPFFSGNGDAPVFLSGNLTGSFSGTSGNIVTDVATTPEPSSFALLGTGLLGVAGILRKRLV